VLAVVWEVVEIWVVGTRVAETRVVEKGVADIRVVMTDFLVMWGDLGGTIMVMLDGLRIGGRGG
jgi:hypothetical protein